MLRPVLAVALVTAREAVRSRLWLVFAAAAALVLLAALHLDAVDQAARLKLAVAVATAALGGTMALLSILVGAQQVRRDLDGRHTLMLFAKPVGRMQYLLGRWLGVQSFLLAGATLLALAGTGAVAVAFGPPPRPAAVAGPSDWRQLTALGEELRIAEDRSRVTLSGLPGDAVRFSLAGLGDPGPEGVALLLRAQVRGDLGVESCRAEVAAAPGAGSGQGRLRLLALDPASPYGRSQDGSPVPEGQVVLRNREAQRDDYTQDWLRLRLERGDVAADGTCTVQVTRRESGVSLILSRQGSCAVARDGGSFLANLWRAGLVVLAVAGMLSAATLLTATLAGLPVALLAGLSLILAGAAVWTVQDTLTYEKLSLPVQRLLQGAQLILPDFTRQEVASRLAAGRALGWDAVGAAWGYFGAYAAGFLALAWWSLRRKEL